MKQFINVLTVAAIIVVLLSGQAHAQTRSGHYSKVTADRWTKEGTASSSTVKYKTGSLIVAPTMLYIDTNTAKPQVYEIVNRGVIDPYDYGDYIQLATLVYPGKSGLKAMEVVFYIGKDKKTITDVILKKSKHYDLTYTFK